MGITPAAPSGFRSCASSEAALISTTGMPAVAASPCSARRVARPSIAGIIRSRRIASGCCSRARRTPSEPLLAVIT